MSDDSLYRIAAVGLMLVGGAIGGYHRRRAAKAGGGGDVSHKDEPLPILIPIRLGALLGFLVLFGYLIRPAWVSWATVPLPAAVRWTGAAICAADVIFLFFTYRALGTNITDTVCIRANHTLVTHGPYRYVRHPFYIGVGTFLLGVSILTALWALAAASVMVLVMLAVRTPIEERKLIERFGDEYRQYAARTGRFLPRWSR